MKQRSAKPVPFDLSPLPDGFKRAVERGYSLYDFPGEPLVALAHAIAEAWNKSTAKQRKAAEPGVNAVLKVVNSAADPSYLIGVIGSRCLDLDMDFIEDWDALDEVSVFRGVYDGAGIPVNNAIADMIDNFVGGL